MTRARVQVSSAVSLTGIEPDLNQHAKLVSCNYDKCPCRLGRVADSYPRETLSLEGIAGTSASRSTFSPAPTSCFCPWLDAIL